MLGSARYDPASQRRSLGSPELVPWMSQAVTSQQQTLNAVAKVQNRVISPWLESDEEVQKLSIKQTTQFPF
jgi:hypothetical protein